MTESKRIAIYPGSFDPPTRGHLDILQRAAALFDRLVVGVLVNPSKKPLLSENERVQLLLGEIGDLGLGNVEVKAFKGLTVDFAASEAAAWIVRGVRSALDLADETSMANTNRVVSSCDGMVVVETVLLPSRSDLAFIRSKLVREIARGRGSLEELVTPLVEKTLEDKFLNPEA